MSISIHPDCADRLKEIIYSGLRDVTVKDGLFVNVGSTEALSKADEALPAEQKTKLKRFISERPVSDFVRDRISEEIREVSSEESKALSRYEGFYNLENKADKYIGELESLPNKYALFVKIPGRAAKLIRGSITSSSYDLSPDISITVVDDDHVNKYPPPNEEIDFGDGLEPIYVMGHEEEWKEGDVYLRSLKKGYIGPYFSTSLFEEFKFEVRSFFGLALAQRIFDLGRFYNSSSFESDIYSYFSSLGSWERAYSRKMSNESSEKLRELAISRFLEEKVSDDDVNLFVRDGLNEISKAFCEGNKFETIRKSGQWLFDSHCGSNELLHFVQATVALEILLGDKARSDLLGLNELLRNRCAYLIGDNRKQRDEILKDFGDIYDVRSKIVHRGKNQLDRNERKKLYRLR